MREILILKDRTMLSPRMPEKASGRGKIYFLFMVLAATGLVAASATAIEDMSRSTLWVALQGCIVSKKVAGQAFPCLSVDLGNADRPGTAVMRAPGQPTHTIVMPIQDVVGIEAPELRQRTGNAIWRTALANRKIVVDALKGSIAIGDVGIAVNSEGGRSQDHLHVHLDCVEQSVRATLLDRAPSIHSGWAMLTPKLQGTRFQAMRIKSADAETFNPFAALETLPGRGTNPNEVSFAALSTPAGDPDPGFFLLAYRWRGSHAEKLLDHTCLIAKPA